MRLALFSVIIICSTALGLRIGRCVRARYFDDVEALVFGAALGLGGLSYAVLGFGSAGWLNKPLFAGLLLLALAFGFNEMRARVVVAAGILCRDFRATGLFDRALLSAIVSTAILVLCGALAPAIGQDELCYHLAQPRNYVRHGAVYEVPFSVNALWPFMMQMLFTLGELFGGAELAKLFHFMTYILTGAAVACWVRRASGGAGAMLAGAVYLLMPGAFVQAGFAYVDNALALYVLLAAYAMSVYAGSRERPWLLLSGICGGLAISTKLIGLFGVVAVLTLLLARSAEGAVRLKNAVRDVFIFGLAVVAVGGAWYIRSWILRGNPVFPFYPQLFGGNGWNDVTYVDSHGRGQDILSFLCLPWDLTMHPDWFGGEHIGPLYLAFLPAAILLARTRAHIRRALVCAGVYAACWFIVDPNIRFFYAGLALIAVGVGESAHLLTQDRDRRVRATVCVLILTAASFSVALAVRHFGAAAALVVWPSQRAIYLAERERSHIVADAFEPHLRGQKDKVLSLGEVRGYYFTRPFVLEGDFALFTHYGDRYGSSAETVAYLKRLGFTHVLSSDLDGAPDPRSRYGVYAMLRDPNMRERHFVRIARTESHGIGYELYQIKDGDAP